MQIACNTNYKKQKLLGSAGLAPSIEGHGSEDLWGQRWTSVLQRDLLFQTAADPLKKAEGAVWQTNQV